MPWALTKEEEEEWSPSKSDYFTPDERATAAQWKGGWASLGSSLVVVLKTKECGSDRKCINGKE
jgi:hypothetical protein